MHPQRFAILVGVILALTLVACDQERGGPRVVGEDGSMIELTSTATASPSAEVSATIVPSEPTPTASVTPEATETATPEATSTATPTGTPSGGTDIEESSGVPYSTADFQASWPSALQIEAREPDEALCPNTSVTETTLRVGGDDGSLWALWVYPDSEAREADWEFSDGELRAQTDDCEPPTGLNYFNANLVFVVRETGDGIDEMRDAFLDLAVEVEDEDD